MKIIFKLKMKITLAKISALLLLATSLVVTTNPILVNPVFAQTPAVSLTVSPPVSYLHVIPGTSANHTVVLENTSETPITVLPTIVDFTTDGKTGGVILTNQLTFPYIWVGENSVEKVTIPPGEKKSFLFHIDVPTNAQEKEYPLTVLFFTESQKEDFENNISPVRAAIGSNLIVLVAKQSEFTKILEVLEFNAPKIIDSFQKVEFSPLVKNNSLGAIAASGSAKIVNWRKQTVAEFQIYPDTILGHNSRELRALLSSSDQKPEVGSFSYKPKFMIGPYQIVLTMVNQNNEVIIQNIHVFYALPISIVIAIAIGVIIWYFYSKPRD